MYYAQLNGNNICIGVSQLSKELIQDNMIKIEKFDNSIVGKKYAGGEWVDVVVEHTVPEPTEQEIINAQLLLTQQEIIAKQVSLDETLALILLNQQGV
jgi:hypothetical protein